MIERFSKNSEVNKDEELDLSAVLRLFLRNKVQIFKFGIIFFVGFCVFALTQKRVWQGQFEIVIENSKRKMGGAALFDQLSQISIIGGMGGKNDDLLTEVGILNSQSVLMPIFDFTNQIKSDLNKKYKIPTYGSWNSNLKVELKKNTSIVNISYKDQNKEIIIPVLEKISSSYQEYSKSRKNRAIELSKIYLQEQISNFKEKAKKSKRIALNYAIDQNLNVSDLDSINNFDVGKSLNDAIETIGVFQLGNSSDFSDNTSNSLEGLRVKLKNEINEIDLQIEKVKKLNNIDDLQYIGATIEPLVEQGLPQTLEKIETKLMQLRAKYTEKDSSIIKLLETRDLYTKLLKERAIGYLKAKKISYESKLDSVKRPKGVIVKGKELMREANRDESTLVELENNLRKLELLEAKLEDPWKLITDPTLSNIPVYPNRKKIGLIGLFSGLIIGIIYSYAKEKNSNLIFEENALEKICSIPILKRVNLNEIQSNLSNKELRFEELENISKNKIKLILLSNGNEAEIKENFKNLYSNLSKEKYDLIYSVENLSDVDPKDINLLVTRLGKLTYLDVRDFKNRLDLLKINLSGIIII